MWDPVSLQEGFGEQRLSAAAGKTAFQSPLLPVVSRNSWRCWKNKKLDFIYLFIYFLNELTGTAGSCGCTVALPIMTEECCAWWSTCNFPSPPFPSRALCPHSHTVLQETRAFLARNMSTWWASGTMADRRCLTRSPTLHTQTHTHTHDVHPTFSRISLMCPISGWLCTYVHVWHCDFPAYIALLQWVVMHICMYVCIYIYMILWLSSLHCSEDIIYSKY